MTITEDSRGHDPRADERPDRSSEDRDLQERDCGCGERCSCNPPKALERNTFFPRKLMEVRHWQAEQAYHRRARELATRLGLGSGVLCGLEVSLLPTGTLLVTHGVGVDGHGRLVVVPHDVEVDPTRLTDHCGRAVEATRGSGTVTVSVCYHECGTDLVRMPPEGCEDEGRCVPSMVREAFAFTVTEGQSSRAGLPDGLCEALFCSPGDPGPDPQPQPDPQPDSERAAGSRPQDPRLVLDRLDPRSCGCAEECIPLATVTLEPHRDSSLDTSVRTVLRSNRELLDLILCVAHKVDECCDRLPVAPAPRVTGLWPWPDDEGAALGEFAESRRLEVAFDRDMAEQGLDDPDSWLGVWLIEPKGAHRLAVHRAPGALGHVAVPNSGDGAAYTVEMEAERIRRQSCVVVMVRSQPLGAIRAAGPGGLALDAELTGTGLSLEQRDKLWAMAPTDTEPAYRTFFADAVVAPPAVLPSGDGTAGGELHVTYRPAKETVPPPRLLAVWPPGGVEYGERFRDRVEDWKRFLERPRIELTVSRALADAAAGAPVEWIRLWQTTQDGDLLYALREVKLEPGEPEDLGDGSVRITFPVRPDEKWHPRAVCLAQLRSTPPVAAESPVGREDPRVLLDADYSGTALDTQTLFQVWTGDPTVEPLPVLQARATEGQRLYDGNEGGLVHWGFTVQRP